MQSRTILYFLFLLAGSYFTHLQAQQKGFSNYSLTEGLPQSRVTVLLEDSRGILWIGTQSAGLARFDGNEFKTLTTRQGLIDNHILSLFEDKQGQLWIGTQTGISIYDGKKFKSLKTGEKKAQEVHAIWQQNNGRIWIGTQSAVYTYSAEGLEHSGPQNTFRTGKVHCFFGEKNGAVWIGHSKGLLRILGEERKTFTAKEGLNSPDIRAITADSSGNIWIGSILGGVHRFDGRAFIPQFLTSRIHEGFILDLVFDSKGDLWISNQLEGLANYNFKSQSFQYFGTAQGLPHKHISDILEDSWGNIWLATLGGGISKYTSRNFVHIDKEQGLPAQNVLAIATDSMNQVWLGLAGMGLAVYDGARFQLYNRQHLFSNVDVKSIYKDRRNRMWIGTGGRGLALFQDTSFQFFSNTDTFKANFIQDIKEDAEGYLWVATKYQGIFKISTYSDSLGTQLKTEAYTKAHGLISNNIEVLHFDIKGRLWYGTKDQGLGLFHKEGTEENLNSPILDKLTITCLAEDSQGYLWIGTAEQGLHRLFLHDEKFSIPSFKGAFTSDGIKFIQVDGQDRLWVGTEAGINRVLINPERNIQEVKHLGRDEGLLDTEINQHAGYMTPEGKLWIGANSGLSIFQSNKKQKKQFQPRIYLEQVKLFYDPLQDNDQYAYLMGPWGKIKHKMNFAPDDNHLSFEFNGIDLSQSGPLKYQFRMKGLEKKWSPLSTKKDAAYPNLAAGSYTFQVKSVNSEEIESEVLEIPLHIEIPVYLKKEFIAGAILALALLIWGIFKLRLNQVRAIARIDQEKISIEKDLIQLEQKALRLQMNPHFLFNALNSIQGLISREDSKNARYYLAKFSKLMRLVLENSRESMINLSEEIETLEHYLTVEQFSSGDKFSYNIQVADELDPEEVLIPPMMIQPFIENAIIHGVAHLSKKGNILIEFRKIGQRVECYISDNGVGRKKAKEIKSQQAHKHKSTALLVTQERLDIISKGADWGKSIEMVDLMDAEGKPAGTKVILRIPLVLDR